MIDETISFIIGIFIGALFILISNIIPYYGPLDICASQNNVYSCEWVAVPVIQGEN